jgi:hypothetical protein
LVIALGALALGCGDDPPGETGGSAGAGGMIGSGGAGGGMFTGGAGGVGGAGCVDSLPVDDALPESLSATGLYADIATKTLGRAVRGFAPRYALWSDGADKQRWVYLPECGVIDTSDMNDWSLPIGARLWKEFTVGGVRIETRLIERIGPGANDFSFAAYAWNAAETEATRVPQGVIDALGTTHDIPNESSCRRCHGSHAKGGGRPSRALGFSALQLGVAGAGVTLASLADDGKLSDPHATGIIAPVGADAVEQAALGYLHANCGHCHNDSVDHVPQLDMNLWLDVEHDTAAQTGAYLTAIGVATTLFVAQGVTTRIAPGDAAASALWFRMNERGNNAQMPPVASEQIDATALADIAAWIGGLP